MKRNLLSYDAFIKYYYGFWSLLVILIMLLSLFVSTDYIEKSKRGDGHQSGIVFTGGNLSNISRADYFLHFVPDFKKKYQPRVLFKKIKTLKIKNQAIVVIKILWAALALGVFIAVFSRAKHGRYFVPLISIFSALILMLMLSLWEKSVFPQNFSFYPGMRQAELPGKIPDYISTTIHLLNIFFVINIIIDFFVLFYSGTEKYFSRHNIFPSLLPLEQRNDYNVRLYHNKKKTSLFRQSMSILIHLFLLLFFSLLIGNFIYVPVFLVQVHNPELTFYLSIFALAFIQLFYLYGYTTALNTKTESSSIPLWKKLLLSLSFLSYKFIKNITRVFLYSGGVLFLIIVLLLIILTNLHFLESIKVLPVKVGF